MSVSNRVRSESYSPVPLIVMVIVGSALAFGNLPLPRDVQDFAIGGVGMKQAGLGLMALGFVLLVVNRYEALTRSSREKSKQQRLGRIIQSRKLEGGGVNYSSKPRRK